MGASLKRGLTIEVFSRLSTLYPLIEQRRDTLTGDLNDILEPDSDESIVEYTTHDNASYNERLRVYMSTAQVLSRGRDHGSI